MSFGWYFIVTFPLVLIMLTFLTYRRISRFFSARPLIKLISAGLGVTLLYWAVYQWLAPWILRQSARVLEPVTIDLLWAVGMTVLGAGVLFFGLKSWKPRIYGVLEILAGTVGAEVGTRGLAQQQIQKYPQLNGANILVQEALILLTGIYVVVRGLEKITQKN